MAVIFKKISLKRYKIGIKNEVKTFCFGDHIRTWTVISPKKFFTLFSNQRAARGFNGFSKSGPSCEKLAHPCYRIRLLIKETKHVEKRRTKLCKEPLVGHPWG